VVSAVRRPLFVTEDRVQSPASLRGRLWWTLCY